MTAPGLLLIGYGNPGRGDDGLGPALARRIEARSVSGVTVEIDYQLTVDHALMISGFGAVVFADAALDAEGPFYFRRLDGAAPQALGSHSVTPEAALGLAGLLFGARPEGHVLGLRGASYGAMDEGLSVTALASLERAEAFLLDWLDRRHGPAP
jgi:hydrogenase maturation protease